MMFSLTADRQRSRANRRQMGARIDRGEMATECGGNSCPHESDAALEGLRKIREALRREYQLSDEELKPISELIAELDPSH
jgi:hypothetical protein